MLPFAATPPGSPTKMRMKQPLGEAEPFASDVLGSVDVEAERFRRSASSTSPPLPRLPLERVVSDLPGLSVREQRLAERAVQRTRALEQGGHR